MVSGIPLYKVHMPKGLGPEIQALLESGQISGGPKVAEFERNLQAFLQSPFLTSAGDCSTALALCLLAAGVRPGDEVVVSPMVCLATTCPIANVSATIRWCDVDPWTGNPTAATIAAALTPRTRAIILYHWAGYPAELGPVRALAASHGIALIEDAGEALGADYRGAKIGGPGSGFAVFSFYPNRHITTIDGAAVALGSEADWEYLRWQKRYGIHQPTFRTAEGEIDPESDIRVAGFNSYMNQVAACIGLRQLESLPGILQRHRENGRFYRERLAGMGHVEPLAVPADCTPAYWVFTLLTDDPDRLGRRLRSKGIAASRVHLRNDRYSCFPSPGSRLPGVDRFAARSLSIPCGWWVADQDRERIVQEIAAAGF